MGRARHEGEPCWALSSAQHWAQLVLGRLVQCPCLPNVWFLKASVVLPDALLVMPASPILLSSVQFGAALK